MRSQSNLAEAALALAPNGAPSNVRAILRVTIEYHLRSLDAIGASMDDDLVKGLIYTFIWSANVQHLINSADNLAYGPFNELPPDELRRPVSVLAIADGLRLPYETVRRRVEQLIRDDCCVRLKGRGLIVPARAHVRPNQLAAGRMWFAHLRRYIVALRRSGFDFAPFPSTDVIRAPTAEELPANFRAVLRIASEVFLRSVIFLAQSVDSDFIAGVIFTAIWTANVAGLTGSQANAQYGGIDDIPPDELRRPVSVLALANSLRLPYETVRRYVNKMVRDGLCLRVGSEGLIVPRAVLEQDKFKNSVAGVYPLTVRFMGELQRAKFDFGF